MKSGSVDDIVARLILWGRRAPKGFARIEFDSEFARKRVVNVIRFEFDKESIPFYEIELPFYLSASEVVRDLTEKLTALESGVVSINGFATAFSEEVPLEDALQVFNFNRETLARPNLRQIWWMPSFFAERFIRAVPDLNSWFLVRLHLTEEVSSSTEVQPIAEEPSSPGAKLFQEAERPTIQLDRDSINLDDARRRSRELVHRFEYALRAGTQPYELRRDFVIPAVGILHEAGAEKESQELARALAQKITEASSPSGEQEADFFISYNSADRSWAEWIAWQLEEEGYVTVLQAWDFRPGSNFVLSMQKAATKAKRTIIVLSPGYLVSQFTQPEWAAAFAQDPLGEKGLLIPIRVRECAPEGMLGTIVYIDLVGLDEVSARDRLLFGIRTARHKPEEEPEFPGSLTSVVGEQPEFPGTLRVPWNVPYARNLFFTGRENLLKSLHNALRSYQAVALSGLGGIGKTQIAVEYTYRHQNDYTAILWVNASSREILITEFGSLARTLNLPEKNSQDENEAIDAVKRWLEANAEWLLIFDNADSPTRVLEFLPQKNAGKVLFTTRLQATGPSAHCVAIEKMEPDEGALFLLRRAKIIPRDALLDKASDVDRTKATELLIEMDGLPLALDQAGAFIEETPSTLAEYLDLYQTEGERLRASRGDFVADHPESVTITFSLAFAKVTAASPAAADLLCLCAFLAPDAIPEEIFSQGAPDLGTALSIVASRPLELINTIKEAGRFSLLHRNPATKTLSIHRLVQTVLRDEMDKTMQRQWAERAVRAMERTFPHVEFSTWPRCERLLPHALAGAHLVREWRMEFLEATRLLNQISSYLKVRARYAEAEPLLRWALRTREKILGPDHPAVATLLSNLATLYNSRGRYSEAEPLLQRALTNMERALGPDHPAVATLLSSLGDIWRAQKNYIEAEKLHQRALTIRKQLLGQDSPLVAESLNNLAAVYYDQHCYDKAEPYYQEALAILEKVLGPERPAVAITLGNLARLYQKQGKDAEAEPLYKRALAISERVLGPNHPNVNVILKYYADLLRTKNREAETNELEARAKAIQDKNA